jgi:hypothetical protein
MAEVSVNRSYNVPAEKVWALATDLARWSEWNTMLTKWKSEPPTSIEVGSQATAVMTIMGMANTITLTVDELDAPKSLVMSGTGMAGAKITMTLDVEAGAEGTNFAAKAEFVSTMMVGAIGGAVERAAKKELDASLSKVNDLIAA